MASRGALGLAAPGALRVIVRLDLDAGDARDGGEGCESRNDARWGEPHRSPGLGVELIAGRQGCLLPVP